MATILDTIVETKKQEIDAAKRKTPETKVRELAVASGEKRPFEDILATPGPSGVNIIAEIKRASPSKGSICPDLDPVEYAKMYEQGGAAAISVLTDQPYFKGSLNDLILARGAVSLPVLRKEFIISEYQIYESCAAGADAVLLIVRILAPVQLADYVQLCKALGLGALVEIHAKEEIDIAANANARIIGINNRDLASFKTNINVASNVAGFLGPGQVPVAASGIHSAEDVQQLKQAGIFNFLIGESIVRSDDPVTFIASLSGVEKQ